MVLIELIGDRKRENVSDQVTNKAYFCPKKKKRWSSGNQ